MLVLAWTGNRDGSTGMSHTPPGVDKLLIKPAAGARPAPATRRTCHCKTPASRGRRAYESRQITGDSLVFHPECDPRALRHLVQTRVMRSMSAPRVEFRRSGPASQNSTATTGSETEPDSALNIDEGS